MKQITFSCVLLWLCFSLEAKGNRLPAYWKELQEITITVNESNFIEFEKKISVLQEKYPDDIEIKFAKINFYMNAGKSYEADTYLNTILPITDIDSFYKMYLKAQILIHQDKLIEARKIIEDKSIFIENSLSYLYSMGTYYIKCDSLQLSLYYFQKFLAKSKDENFSSSGLLFNSYIFSGFLNNRLGYLEQAKKDFRDAFIVSHPLWRYPIYYQRAICYYKEGNKKEGNINMKLCLKTARDTLDMALAHAYLGDSVSVVLLMPALLRKKTDDLVKERDKYYYLACIAAVNRQYSLALEFLEKCFQLGYRSFNWIETDFNLINIQELPEYKLLLQKYKAL